MPTCAVVQAFELTLDIDTLINEAGRTGFLDYREFKAIMS